MVVGLYVGAATVGGAAYWFLYDPTGPQLSYYQISHFLQCHNEPEKFKGVSCEIFQVRVRLEFMKVRLVFVKVRLGPQLCYYQISHFLQCHNEPEKFKGVSCEIFQVRVTLS